MPATAKKMEIVTDLWVCADCCMFHANGPDDLDAETVERIVAGCEREAKAGGRWALDGPREGEHEEADTNPFSWRPCACCGSKLGGSRHRAAVIYPDGGM